MVLPVELVERAALTVGAAQDDETAARRRERRPEGPEHLGILGDHLGAAEERQLVADGDARAEPSNRRRTARVRGDGFDGPVKVLTSCPSCLQGLSRYDDDAGTGADYIVVEMARHLLGEHWLTDYVSRANDGGIERVLV